MHTEHDPNKAFPAEVLALQERGIPLPTWYAGPLYTGNGTAEALQELERVRSAAADDTAASSDEADAVF